MPYDAPDYSQVLWDHDKPYWRTASGGKTFIPPLVAAQMRDNPTAQSWAARQGVQITYGGTPENPTVENIVNNAAPGGSLLRQRGEWNSQTGEWDRPINWSNIASLAVGGAIAAPFVVPALAGIGGGSGAAGGAGVGLGETGATAGLAGSGFGTGAGLGFSAVPAAAGTAAGVGSAAGSGAGLASSTIAPTTGTLAPGVAASGAVPSAMAGTSAGGGMAGLVSSKGIGGFGWGDIINAGLSFVQSRQSANAAQQASQAQIDAANRALDLQRDQYNTSRQDYLDNREYTRQQMTGLQPYQQAGAGALGTLQRLTGTQAPQGLAPTTQPYPGAAGAGPPGGYASTIRPGGGGGGTVTILDPSSGVTQQRPAGELQHWISVGGRQVG